MTESLFEPIEDEDFLPGAHNPCALVHNPFEWDGVNETVDTEEND
ncbi:MAG TPA: hypothetical protein VHH34_03350 [Pseudonocardiaceae bacterium]|nr:hypothetical protein [Pseudonocardiaceae bacterium]